MKIKQVGNLFDRLFAMMFDQPKGPMIFQPIFISMHPGHTLTFKGRPHAPVGIDTPVKQQLETDDDDEQIG